MSNYMEKIISVTGRTITECGCKKCQSQCQTPCLGTPDDILKLIYAGYAYKPALTSWMVGMLLGEIQYPIQMVQPLATVKGCVFFENGLCELHNLGLKPTEGKLSYHTITSECFYFNKSLSWNVAKEWLQIDNIQIILKVFVLMKQ